MNERARNHEATGGSCMAMIDTTVVHICPRCLNCEEGQGPCRVCGTEVLACEAGSTEDRIRRPLIDNQGRVRTRAPRWWLRKRVGKLAKYFE